MDRKEVGGKAGKGGDGEEGGVGFCVVIPCGGVEVCD